MMFRFEQAKQEDNSVIDQKIKRLVDKMNATGVIRTVASCQGHACGKPPYVFFSASPEIAAAIERRLRETSMNNRALLKTIWTVEGVFDADYNLSFILFSPEYHEKSLSMAWPLFFYCFFYKRIDAEFAALSNVVEEAVLLKLRDENMPCVNGSAYEDAEAK